MNAATLAQIAGALAFLGTAYTILDSIRRRNKERIRAELSGDQLIVQSAIELLRPYKEEVAELKMQVTKLKGELKEATQQIDQLTNELTELKRRNGAMG